MKKFFFLLKRAQKMAKLLKIFLRIGSKKRKNGLLQHISDILQLTGKILYVITPEIFCRIRIFFIEFRHR